MCRIPQRSANRIGFRPEIQTHGAQEPRRVDNRQPGGFSALDPSDFRTGQTDGMGERVLADSGHPTCVAKFGSNHVGEATAPA